MEVYAANVERMMRRMYGSLNERDRRWYAAFEAAKLGHGGIEYVARVVGCDPKTVRLGLDEMESEAEPLVDRQQKKKGAKAAHGNVAAVGRKLSGRAEGSHRW